MSDSQTSHDSTPDSPDVGPSTRPPRRRGQGATRSAEGRGRGARGRGTRGRGTRGRGSGRGLTLNLSPEDIQRMQDLQAQRIDFEDRLIGRLSIQQSHQMLRDILHHDPSLVFDLRLRTSEGAPPVPPSTAAAPSWCVCARCREMPTDLERKCCRFRPEECISTMPHMEIFILMEGHLRMARRLWNDIRAVEDAQTPGESNRQFRHAAYRQWVVWQYGSLGSGRRVVVPSCCVWAIRYRFPDPNGHYVGFIPSRV